MPFTRKINKREKENFLELLDSIKFLVQNKPEAMEVSIDITIKEKDKEELYSILNKKGGKRMEKYINKIKEELDAQ